MANASFDTAGKQHRIHVPIGTGNTTDGLLKAAFNGIGYGYVGESLNLDRIVLSFGMSAGVNAAGSGNTKIGIYVVNPTNGLNTAVNTGGLYVDYASAYPYAVLDRGDMTVKALKEGDIIRIDLLAVPGGAATSYAINAMVTFMGQGV